MKMSIEDDEFYVMTDSDEFRACETMAQQETPIKVAVSRLIDFYGMCEEDAHSYYMEALQKNMTQQKSPELREMEQEEFDQEPSLDKLMPDLLAPENAANAKAFFAAILADEDEEAKEKSATPEEELYDETQDIVAEQRRRLKVRRMFKGAGQTQNSSPSQSGTPKPTGSN